MEKGAIILCGGRSTRMGKDKATLQFGPEQMLPRVIRLVSLVVDPRNIVVVASPQQILPAIPAAVCVTYDEQPDQGPLEGMAAGLNGLANRVDAAYVTSCDVPLLVPEFVRKMFELLGDCDIAVPRDDQHYHPLAAVYRTSVLGHVQRLLDTGRRSPRSLFVEVKTREVDVEELRRVDPWLATLENVNHPEDYHRALIAAGFSGN